MSDKQIFKEYACIRYFSHPIFLLPLFLVPLSIITFYFIIFHSLSSVSSVKFHSIITRGRSDLFFLIFICLLASLVRYNFGRKSKIILSNDKIIIKIPLRKDKIIFISDIVYIRKRAVSAVMIYGILEFYLRNGKQINTLIIQDYYDFIDNIKKINPDIKESVI